jgi:hypothetical protein
MSNNSRVRIADPPNESQTSSNSDLICDMLCSKLQSLKHELPSLAVSLPRLFYDTVST